MTIDNKPMEPKIPELPLGVSPQEILGDPRGRDGGGGGQRAWSEGRSRSTTERRRMGAQQGGQRGSRRTTEMRQMRDGNQRGTSRSDPRGGGGGGSRRFDGVDRTSVAWRRIRDSHWRQRGEWLDPVENLEVPSSSDGPQVAEPLAKAEADATKLPWRPWEGSRSDSRPQDQDLSQIVSQLESSVVGSHKENVGRPIPFNDCPSSNLHHFVLPVPHTSHEVYPSLDIRTKTSIFKGKKIDY